MNRTKKAPQFYVLTKSAWAGSEFLPYCEEPNTVKVFNTRKEAQDFATSIESDNMKSNNYYVKAVSKSEMRRYFRTAYRFWEYSY